jgi:hypothetical protein
MTQPNAIDPTLRNCALLCGRADWVSVLEAHENRSPERFMLTHAARFESRELAAALAEQLHCYPIAAAKFPHIHRHGMIYTRKSLAQASAESVLRWRSGLIADDRALVDLTGGLGMDSLALAQHGGEVRYLERIPELMQIARHNHDLLGARAISHAAVEAERWLGQRGDAVDTLFVDPDRRAPITGKRLLRLEDCAPDVPALLPAMRARAHRALIKLSPALDLTLAFRQLQPAIISVVSVHGEVKEMLAHCMSCATTGRVEAVMLDRDGNVRFHFDDRWPTTDEPPLAGDWGEYLYEPDASLIKSGLSSRLACAAGLGFVRRDLAYLTGPAIDAPFPGRCFRILDAMPFKEKQVRRALRSRGLHAVQIHRRDFPQAPEALYGLLKLQPGPQADLFFTRDANRRPQMLITERVADRSADRHLAPYANRTIAAS